ncbi:MBL fold metallo-hydrolase [Aeromicrobium sp. YIM 150415]|nr:MBL fold metallo-hydrolase [Aeromicrobium sp. YIM 150415]MBM9463597.1 MBL fold metallo-hydrolase [Aeromicrobium sp. YIM 150415]
MTGESESVIVDTGHLVHLPVMEAQLDALADEIPPIRWLWTTHQETPHSGGVGRLMRKFPDLRLVGDVRDHHLFFPDYVDRMETWEIGDEIDLGGSTFRIVEPTIKDLNGTQWALDTSRGVLFPGDGFCYGHYHEDDACGHLVEEVEGLAIAEHARIFSEFSLHWMTLVQMEPFVKALKRQLADLDVRMICSTHGLPISDPENTAPDVYHGMLASGLDRVTLR